MSTNTILRPRAGDTVWVYRGRGCEPLAARVIQAHTSTVVVRTVSHESLTVHVEDLSAERPTR